MNPARHFRQQGEQNMHFMVHAIQWKMCACLCGGVIKGSFMAQASLLGDKYVAVMQGYCNSKENSTNMLQIEERK